MDAPSTLQSSPISVSIYPDDQEYKDLKIPQGKIIDLPMMTKEKKPDKADLLAMVNSKSLTDNSPSIEKKKVAIPLSRMKHKKGENVGSMDIKKSKETLDKKHRDKDHTYALLERDPNRFSEALRKNTADKEKKIKVRQKVVKVEPSVPLKEQSAKEITESVREEFKRNMEGREIDEFVKNDPKGYLDRGDETIISLNTKKFKFAKYFSSIKSDIEDVWDYPDEAILNGLKGTALLRFTLLKNGEVEEVTVVKSSGEAVLDDNSVNVIWTAGPFKPFPQTFHKRKIHLIVHFSYRPTYDSVNLHR